MEVEIVHEQPDKVIMENYRNKLKTLFVHLIT